MSIKKFYDSVFASKLGTYIQLFIEWYVENGDTRTLANLQVLQSKLNHPRQ